ncbi:MAG: hypothetical protein HYW22_01095 [Candidatus Aenigmarchaeota archaeon]|nr:hypothetical protein [Candidatus Aenigmarchaeota archaeon]
MDSREDRSYRRTFVGRVRLSDGRALRTGIYSDPTCTVSIEDIAPGLSCYAKFDHQSIGVTVEIVRRPVDECRPDHGYTFPIFVQTSNPQQLPAQPKARAYQ